MYLSSQFNGKTFLFLMMMGTLFNTQPIHATLIHIPATYATIQMGIDSSSNGDTILIQPGTYMENLNFHGKNITVGSLFITTGLTSYISSTVVNGNTGTSGDGSTVTFETGETPLAKLTGLTITGGTGNFRSFAGLPYHYGGGIFCNGADPTLDHLNIISNSSEGGGGLFLYNSNASIRFCEISNNTSIGMVFDAPNCGGGILFWNCAQPRVENSKILNNDCYSGGGIYLYISHPTIVNCLIAGNHTSGLGSAVYADSWTYVDIINSTITQNICDTSGFESAIYGLDSANIYIYNSIIYDNNSIPVVFQFNYAPNSITVSHSDMEGGMGSINTQGNATINWLTGNIDSLPQFINPGINDFHLQNTSPCINAGDTTGLTYIPSVDLDSFNRFIGHIDMGCYENQLITAVDPIYTNHLKMGAYPNPVLHTTTITGTHEGGLLMIYDMNGKIILQVPSQEMVTPISMTGFADGIYQVRYLEQKTSGSIRIVKQ